jgi:hypothetical protein
MGPKKDRQIAAALLGRKGGKARAKALTAAQRSKIAKLGAASRWGKKDGRA